jgi:hypothetical protein
MKRELTARVGPDGVLALTVALRPEDANKAAHVIIETAEGPTARPPMSQQEWTHFVQSMAGRITDPTFERPPQGEYEQRDPLP